jgi:Tol biopolymer transport system component
MSGVQAGLYVVDADGSNARALLERSDIAISYWDWTTTGRAAPATLPPIGAAAPRSRLLYGGSVFEKGTAPPPGLFTASADRWVSREITPEGSPPLFARWSPDRSRVVFTAKITYDPNDPRPGPPPPAGAVRRTHITVDNLSPGFDPPVRKQSIAEEQIFMMETEGSYVLQLTTPWTEDYLDALPDGDHRGNVDPDFSPDGRYVVFTSVSTLSFESFILRLDLMTGEVLSLTNMTSGAMPVADAQPRYSPDGSSIAFVSAVGRSLQVFVMSADGSNVHQITDDDYYNAFPTWSPDGSAIAYASYRGEQFPVLDELSGEVTDGRVVLQDWYLSKVDVATRTVQVLTTADESPVFRPVWSPEGDRIAYISAGASGQPDIYILSVDGGPPRPLAVTLLTKEEYVDWR